MNQYQFMYYFHMIACGVTVFSLIIILNHIDDEQYTFSLYGYLLEGFYLTLYIIGFFPAIGFMLFMMWWNMTAHKIKVDLDGRGRIC